MASSLFSWDTAIAQTASNGYIFSSVNSFSLGITTEFNSAYVQGPMRVEPSVTTLSATGVSG